MLSNSSFFCTKYKQAEYTRATAPISTIIIFPEYLSELFFRKYIPYIKEKISFFGILFRLFMFIFHSTKCNSMIYFSRCNNQIYSTINLSILISSTQHFSSFFFNHLIQPFQGFLSLYNKDQNGFIFN